MPAKVLEIKIDDKDYQAFLKTFERYQRALAEQPTLWNNVDGSIKDTVNSATSFIDSLQSQLDLMEKASRIEDDRERKNDDARRKRKKANEEDARDEEKATNRRRTALDQIRDYGRNIDKIVKNGGSWAAGVAEGVVSNVAGGAGGLFGSIAGALKGIPFVGGVLGAGTIAAYEAASSLSSSRQQARGLGVNVQTLQGWKAALGPYLPPGSAENLLSTVSEAQATPGGGALFGRFGIKDYNNKGVSDLSAEMLTKAQGYLKAHPGAQGLWGARSLYGGALDTGTLRTLQTMSPKELQDAIAQMKKFAKDNSSADDTAAKATDALSKSELTMTSVLDKSSKVLVYGIGAVADEFKNLVDATNQLVDAMDKGSGGKHPSVIWKDPDPLKTVQNMWKLQRGVDFSAKDSKSVAGVYANAMLKSGWSPQAVRGMLSNAEAESSFNPFAHVTDKFGQLHYGLVQWNPERASAYTKHFGHTMESVKDPLQAAREQAWLENYELRQGKYSGLGSRLNSMSAFGAGFSIAKEYETPATGLAMFGIATSRGLRANTMSLESDTGHVARAVTDAVKKGVVKAHHSTRGHTTVQIKTQHKPGSDTVVSARQLAGH